MNPPSLPSWSSSSRSYAMSPPPDQTVLTTLRANRKKYYDGCITVVLLFIWTLLICALQQVTASINDFPAPILAMVLVAAVMILGSKCVAGLDELYGTYLRGPTDLFNRHMSIGFTVPFTMIMNGPRPDSKDVSLIVAGYLITGILNTALVYIVSLGLQTALTPRKDTGENEEAVPAVDRLPPVLPIIQINSRSSIGSQQQRDHEERGYQQRHEERVNSCVSESTTITNNPSVCCGSDIEANTEKAFAVDDRRHEQRDETEPSWSSGLKTSLIEVLRKTSCFVAANPILCFSFPAIFVIGVPIAHTTGNDTALDTFLLVFLWTGMLAAQAAVKQARQGRLSSARRRYVAAACLNAVLWTSLGTIAYVAAKAAVEHRTVSEVLGAFSTGTTLADLIHSPSGTSSSSGSSSASSSSPSPSSSSSAGAAFGAGDLAVSFLDAAIVNWGLKLFECRAQLLSRAGLTTLAVGTVFAAANVVGGPLLTGVRHGLGLAPASQALAFAARSVTLALAMPAMTNLGGDVGLNAAMVVFNGIVFQVAMGLAGGSGSGGSGKEGRRGCWIWTWQKRAGNDEEEARPSSSSSPSSPSWNWPSPRRSDSGADTLADRAAAGDVFHDGDLATSGGGGPTTQIASGVKEPRRPDRAAVHAACMRGGGGSSGVSDAPVPAASPEHIDSDSSDSNDTPGTVAVGMTVGMNAAAMGTAYLYEDGSRAAPYAALSMTVFGVMTVVFTSIRPLADWVVSQVS